MRKENAMFFAKPSKKPKMDRERFFTSSIYFQYYKNYNHYDTSITSFPKLEPHRFMRNSLLFIILIDLAVSAFKTTTKGACDPLQEATCIQ
jgi:hypothetical protein